MNNGPSRVRFFFPLFRIPAGGISAELAKLSNLQHLNLFMNQLTGEANYRGSRLAQCDVTISGYALNNEFQLPLTRHTSGARSNEKREGGVGQGLLRHVSGRAENFACNKALPAS